MPRFVKKNLYPLSIFALVLLISFLNYKSGTFLTGWDTLQSELNFSLNFKRLIFGVWRSEQGLGAVAGHSHMADLPRLIILWFLDFILPTNALRYTYVFLCLLVGPLGIYYLIKHLSKKPAVAFLSSLFYLFNLSTLQQFIVPFEMFTTQYAFLPWIILSSLKFLKKPTKKHLLYFSLITLFATPQAYAAHLWYAFFFIYLCFLLIYLFQNKHSLRKIFLLIVFTLTINSFWLLPNFYFIATSRSVPKNAKVNRLYSQEFLLKNRQRGYFSDLALQQGFYFDWDIYDHNTTTFTSLTAAWDQHLTPNLKFIGFFLFFLNLGGLCLSFIFKSKSYRNFLPFFIIPFVLLLNHTPPFEQVFDLLITIPTINEAFRFIFTKLSAIFSFSLTIYFSFFLITLFQVFQKIKPFFFTFIFTPVFFIYCWPYFQGQLISPQLKLSFPHQYQQLDQFLAKQPPGLILPLPLHNFVGWQYYDWGYQGSGFIWFGFPQAILDRDFDRWNTKNEQSYQDFFQAVYSKDTDQFITKLNQYHIQYLLWDQSVITPYTKNRDQILFKNEIDQLLTQLQQNRHVTLLNQFGHLKLYQISPPNASILGQNTSKVDIDLSFSGQDFYIPPRFQDQISYQDQDISFSSLNQNVGINLDLNELPHNQSYQLGLKSSHISGLPLRICLKNIYNNICVVEDELTKNSNSDWTYFTVPGLDEFSGFSLNINNISLGNYPSQNILHTVTINSLPVNSDSISTNLSDFVDFNVSPPKNIFFTKITTTDTQINFPQSYNSGWLAFYFNGLRPIFLKDHVLINNWANGWKLDQTTCSNMYGSHICDPQTIYILFWPQLLQFLGFSLIPLSIFWILKSSHSPDR